MNMNGIPQLPQGGTEGDEARDFLHEICGMSAEDVGTEQTALARFTAEFDHSFGFAHRQRLAVGTVEGFVTFEGCADLLQLVFGGAHAGRFGFSEDGRWHHIETNLVLNVKDTVDHVNSLHLCSVGQHLTAVDIADGKEMGVFPDG